MTVDVSVVVPTYGRQAELDRALRSVRDQTLQPREVIVVDDASPLPICVAEDPIVRVVRRESNGGAAAARNSGVSAASGSIVAFLDSDDEWEPQFLERTIPVLASAAPDVAAVTTGYELLYASGRRRLVVPSAGESLRGIVLRGCPFAPGSTLVARQTALVDLGPWRESLRRYEDYDWLLRLSVRHRLIVVPEVLARIHANDLAPLDVELADRTTAKLVDEPPVPMDSAELRVWRATMRQELAWAAWRSRSWVLFASAQAGAIVVDPVGRLTHLLPRLLSRAHHAMSKLKQGRFDIR